MGRAESHYEHSVKILPRMRTLRQEREYPTMNGMRILVIEDEPRVLKLLRNGLHDYGHSVMTATDGLSGCEIASTVEFDGIVLDIGLPCLNGYGVMKKLRGRGCSTPVLMLTARDTEDDIIRGLDLGADDYLTKPFSFPELVARLQNITRPNRKEDDGIVGAGGVSVDAIRQSATRSGRRIDLTRFEFLLLACLVRKAGQCVPRQQLVESVWGPNHAVRPGALDVLVNLLRAKIDTPFPARLIHTVRGSGYIFRKNVEDTGSAA